MSLAPSGGYTAWAAWLDAFARGQDLSTRRLPAIDDKLGPHMQARLVNRVVAAFQSRLKTWHSQLGRDLGSVSGRTPDALGAMLVAARSRLRPLRELAGNPLLPAALRTQLNEALSSSIDTAQETLEESASRHGAQAARLRAIAREHPLNARPAPATKRTGATPPHRGLIL